MVGLLYLFGAALVFWGNYEDERFMASPGQFLGLGLVIAGLIVAAFTLPRRQRREPDPGPHREPDPHRVTSAGVGPPKPWQVDLVAFALTSAWWGPEVLVTPDWYEWINVVVWCAVAIIGLVLIVRWSRRDGWDQRYRLALAAGATATYIWVGFPVPPTTGGAFDAFSNALFAAIAVAILAGAAYRLRGLRPVSTSSWSHR